MVKVKNNPHLFLNIKITVLFFFLLFNSNAQIISVELSVEKPQKEQYHHNQEGREPWHSKQK